MIISNLRLYNFRNYEQLNIDFSNNLNIIYGNNGTGKSNLIEAIYLLSLSKSFRTMDDNNLIRKNSDVCLVKGVVDNKTYFIELNKNSKKLFIDNKKITKVGDFISKINIVLFNPYDTKIFIDSPSNRRKLLNIEISQINSNYIKLISDYNKILKNRNAYLKELYLNSNGSLEYLNILTQKLITLGMEICKIRESFIDNINKNLTSIYKNIFDYGNLEIKYRSDYKNKSYEDLENVYKKNIKTELNYRKTMIGVHHDDFDFILDGYNIKEYGSVGQQKNAIISFKLAELILIKLINGSYPILILDDLFSELDSIKINNIIKMLNKEVQTFITTTDINDVDKSLLEESNIYYANNGQIERKN